MNMELFLIKSPLGTFIGIATNIDEARVHWGTMSDIRPIANEHDLTDIVTNERLHGPERILLAW